MGSELAEAAALHARLMVEQEVTDLYTGDCRGCGECCSRFLPMSLLDRARLRAYVRRHGVAAHAPWARLDLTCPYLTDGRECSVDWQHLFGRFREGQPRLPELDRRHVAQRRVDPEVVVPVHVVRELGP